MHQIDAGEGALLQYQEFFFADLGFGAFDLQELPANTRHHPGFGKCLMGKS